ncbi:magnesium transport protein corA, partial [Escherichia coli TW07945]
MVLLIVNNKILNLPIRKLFPTPIASSYGMNFEFMPELKWSFGYPGAIIFMILAG